MEQLLTAEQVADLLQIKTATVWKKARAGEIPRVHVGRRVRFRREDVDSLIAVDPSSAPTPPKLAAVQTLTVEGAAEDLAEIEALAKKLGVRVKSG